MSAEETAATEEAAATEEVTAPEGAPATEDAAMAGQAPAALKFLQLLANVKCVKTRTGQDTNTSVGFPSSVSFTTGALTVK